MARAGLCASTTSSWLADASVERGHMRVIAARETSVVVARSAERGLGLRAWPRLRRGYPLATRRAPVDGPLLCPCARQGRDPSWSSRCSVPTPTRTLMPWRALIAVAPSSWWGWRPTCAWRIQRSAGGRAGCGLWSSTTRSTPPGKAMQTGDLGCGETALRCSQRRSSTASGCVTSPPCGPSMRSTRSL